MSFVKIKIPNQLLIPFGGPKWSIDRISVVGVSTTGTYLQSDTPLAYVDRSKSRALRLRDFRTVVPDSWGYEYDIFTDALDIMQNYLREKCTLATESEKQFLDLYFDYCRKSISMPDFFANRQEEDRPSLYQNAPYNDVNWVFDAMMPLPQAHLYATDPMEDRYNFAPNKMMKVDFAFWTGKRLVAVEIDGSSHSGSEAHIQKDRLLQRSGVHVIHILNSEISKYGEKVINRLLPSEITHFWGSAEEKYRTNPFSSAF